jgi:hypothetical protein
MGATGRLVTARPGAVAEANAPRSIADNPFQLPPEPAVWDRACDVSPSAPLVPASAIERLVVAVGRQAQGTFLDLQLGDEVRIRVVREPSGVAVLLSARSISPSRAAAELRGIVGALRSRGLAVARAHAVTPAVLAPGLRADPTRSKAASPDLGDRLR